MNSYSETSAFEDKASPGLWLVAIVGYVIHVIVCALSTSLPVDDVKRFSTITGYILGALVVPLIIVLISLIWKSNRTQRMKVLIFSIVTGVFVALRLAFIFAIGDPDSAPVRMMEARNTIGEIASSAMVAFERNPLGTDKAAVHKLCGSANAVPREVPRGQAYRPSEQAGADWDAGDDANGWRCLKFKWIPTFQYYQYTYTIGGPYKGPGRGGPDPGPDGFEVAAEGDVDGDGVTSLFTRIGKIDAATGKMELSMDIFVDKEFE